ncbi:ATP-binding protein [Burkholderia vietnamiensis]|uniref:ATP-binding protein n=1 Tax=Burkholderia vietnamiensis TaxID=60552 RepID=UPI001CF375F2|nr:ATP-binding protein [Burkholderia vietnamiensis]MCA7985385.1 ATP-binding protein [Burkholderia vietnamiensis]HDR8936130.1 ATP-binding protein [Burkholderia vietnamiensis]HDR9025526.1 ATP-binding protein [Burkholderia vietnamiensis]HDR9182780.1 ATP-binding protein [Burkholderia vietnamiensis]
MTEKHISVPPDVARISEGLRDTGYDFNAAVADILDNSIAAGADKIHVRLEVDFADSVIISIMDNGHGMNEAGLVNAMKYGSSKRANAKSLGKFGLGLKTASTAFCRRLSVISRDSGESPALRATWDLDDMAASNSWNLEIAAADAAHKQLLDDVALGASGTVVLWENIDRIVAPEGQPIRKTVEKLATFLRDHIAIVFQRFLDTNDARERNIHIKLNGEPIAAWDPFCIVETKEAIAEKKMGVQLPDGTQTSFTVRAFVLPRKEEFSSDVNRIAARISNERQGLYIYRENRLIHGPDWMNMFKQEPHYSLLRVELSFDHSLDNAFQVDIKKSRIELNSGLYEWLRDKFLAGPRREAETRYRKGAAGVAKGAAVLLHTPASNVIEQKASALKTAAVAQVDEKTGMVTVNNNSGVTTTTVRLLNPDDVGSAHVVTSGTLEHGALWEPTIGKNSKAAVALNTGHPFYTKAYLPNKANSTVVQAMDYLLWALAQAELNNINPDNQEAFEEFRIEVSRNLKKLVADLPDPVDNEES